MLLIVRHGETPPNRRGLLLGRADPSLTESGDEQARQLAMALPVPDLVISSPLRRARDTAAAFGRPVELDERWIELDYGELDGQASSAVPDDVWASWRADSSFAPPGGESLAALSSRVRAACVELSAAAAVSTVVVVTHVSPIKAAIAWALDVPIAIAWRMYVEDAGVSRIDIEPTGPVVRWFNRGILRVD
jgi:broad specificity phosphatase PhoE